MNIRPLGECSLPHLAQLLVEDPRRQDFTLIWEDEDQGLINDKVRVMRDLIDKGADVDQMDSDGRTALDILVDPRHHIPTDPKTALLLLEVGARISMHVMPYVVGRLYAEDIRATALMFNARSQTDKPLSGKDCGNYYHALIDTDDNAFILVRPLLTMVRRHDVEQDMDPAEIALFNEWLFETRPLDGNTPVMLAWEILNKKTFEKHEQTADFQEHTLSELCKLTCIYIRCGGDVLKRNHQGRSVISNITAHHPDLSSNTWADCGMEEVEVDNLRAHISGCLMNKETQSVFHKTKTPRI